MSDRAIIKAEDLTKTFHGGVVAVDHIDLSVLRQECFGLLGPNGAGKTTTVKMVYCFMTPTEGALHVLGDDVSQNPRRIKARLGVCPQENNLDPDLTVWDNLRVFARYFDIPAAAARERCTELLHFIGLYHKKGSSIEELSGGMKRRLMMVRSLVNEPELLILDEPTTGLDPQARHQIWETILQLKRQGTTVLLTTHYMDEAQHLCDRLVIMDEGKILLEGRPQELVRRLIGTHVIEISCVPMSPIEDYLKKKGLAYERTATHLFVYVERGEEELAEIIARFGAACATWRTANLEDVFLKTTGRGLRE